VLLKNQPVAWLHFLAERGSIKGVDADWLTRFFSAVTVSASQSPLIPGYSPLLV